MASKDLHNNIKTTAALNPQTLTGNVTTNGAIIDTQGFESLEFVVQSGTITDGTETFTVQEGDQANLSDAAAVAAGDLLGGQPAAFAATDDNAVRKVGYRGNKRYARLQGVGAGQTTGGVFGALAVLSDARNAPVA